VVVVLLILNGGIIIGLGLWQLAKQTLSGFIDVFRIYFLRFAVEEFLVRDVVLFRPVRLQSILVLDTCSSLFLEVQEGVLNIAFNNYVTKLNGNNCSSFVI